jgi:malate dehydrogenase
LKITIVGAAGTVGSCTAFAIAVQGLADELLLIDSRQNLLMNHVMDISAAVVGRHNLSVRGGFYSDMQKSDIVIITAGVHIAGAPAKERLAPNVPIIREISRNIETYCPGAVVITAANPVDLLNLTVYLSTNLDRNKLIGYNLNDSIRFRMAIARTAGVTPNSVEAIVIGDHPMGPVFLFSSIKIDGSAYSLTPRFKSLLQEELRSYLKNFEGLKAGRTAGWTSAAGLSLMVKAIKEDSREVIPCSAVLRGEYGCQSLSMGVPAVIGRNGIHQILETDLPQEEKRDLDEVIKALKVNSDYVRELTGSTRV